MTIQSMSRGLAFCESDRRSDRAEIGRTRAGMRRLKLPARQRTARIDSRSANSLSDGCARRTLASVNVLRTASGGASPQFAVAIQRNSAARRDGFEILVLPDRGAASLESAALSESQNIHVGNEIRVRRCFFPLGESLRVLVPVGLGSRPPDPRASRCRFPKNRGRNRDAS